MRTFTVIFPYIDIKLPPPPILVPIIQLHTPLEDPGPPPGFLEIELLQLKKPFPPRLCCPPSLCLLTLATLPKAYPPFSRNPLSKALFDIPSRALYFRPLFLSSVLLMFPSDPRPKYSRPILNFCPPLRRRGFLNFSPLDARLSLSPFASWACYSSPPVSCIIPLLRGNPFFRSPLLRVWLNVGFLPQVAIFLNLHDNVCAPFPFSSPCPALVSREGIRSNISFLFFIHFVPFFVRPPNYFSANPGFSFGLQKGGDPASHFLSSLSFLFPGRRSSGDQPRHTAPCLCSSVPIQESRIPPEGSPPVYRPFSSSISFFKDPLCFANESSSPT